LVSRVYHRGIGLPEIRGTLEALVYSKQAAATTRANPLLSLVRLLGYPREGKRMFSGESAHDAQLLRSSCPLRGEARSPGLRALAAAPANATFSSLVGHAAIAVSRREGPCLRHGCLPGRSGGARRTVGRADRVCPGA